MRLPRRRFLRLTAGAATLPAVSHIASAQAYPIRPITLIVGAAAGGPTDTIARNLAPYLRALLGQRRPIGYAWRRTPITAIPKHH